MRFIGRVIGLVIVALFVLIQPVAMWTYNFQRILLDSDTYKQVFDDRDFYAESVPRVLPALLSGLENTSLNTAEVTTESTTENTTTADNTTAQITLLGLIEALDEHDWQQIAPLFVSHTWVEQETQKNLDALMQWLDGDTTLAITFDTSTLSTTLAGTGGENGVQQIIAALPQCSANDEAVLEAYFNAETVDTVPYCRPQNETLLEQFTTAADAARLEAATLIPATLDVIGEMRAITETQLATELDNHPPVTPFTDAEMNRFRAGVQLWRNLLPMTLLIPVSLLALIIIFAIRSSKAFFRWTGWALISSSLITLAPLYLLPFIVPEISMDAEIEAGFAAGGKLIAELAGNRMFKIMISAFTWPVLIQSAILIVMGFIFVVLSVLVHDPDSELSLLLSAPPSQTTTMMPQFQTPVGYHIYQPPSGSMPTPATQLSYGPNTAETPDSPSENAHT